jgi:phospholipase A1
MVLIAALLTAASAAGQVEDVEQPGASAPYGGGQLGVFDHAFDRDLTLGDGAREQFSLHKLNYVALGSNDLKLQLSFKYRFLLNVPAYASFTNTIAWDIYEPKDPSRDVTYNPELFYRWRVADPWPGFLDTGYWHASNGRGDEPEKRSLDRLFARGLFDVDLLGRHLLVTPTAYLTLATSEYSPDIDDYLGRWELGLVWKDLLGPDQPGNDLDLLVDIVDPIASEGSVTIGLLLRLEDTAWSPNIYVQYFSGYGDTMLEYAEHRTELRFGMTFYY